MGWSRVIWAVAAPGAEKSAILVFALTAGLRAELELFHAISDPEVARPGQFGSHGVRADYRLIETCPCPLLLLKTTRAYVGARVVVAVDPFHAHDKPATLDVASLGSAVTLSCALAAELRVVHACPRRKEGLQALPTQSLRDDVEAAYGRSIEARVLALTRRHRIEDGRVQIDIGATNGVVPAVVRGGGADVVAIGAVTRSAFKRIFTGHTSERLLDALDCDLLIVKSPSFRSSVKFLPVGRPRSPLAIDDQQPP